MEKEKIKEYIKVNYIQKNAREIAEELNTSEGIIRRLMVSLGLHRENDKKEYIIKNYSTMLTSNIAEYFNCSTTAVISLANHLGIKKENIEFGNNRVYKLDKDYFVNWSRNMAYILGFTIADGYISSRKSNYCLSYCINTKDIAILEYIKKEISPDSKIKSEKAFDNRTLKFYNRSILNIFSKELVESLERLGLTQGKTGKEIFPNIPKEFIGDFLCGFHDGDGSKFLRNNAYRLSFACANKKFLEDLKLKTCFNLGTIKNRNNWYEYVICGKQNCLKLDSLMTKNRDFYLKRKHF